MRGLCKVEDYEFLGMSEKMRKDGIGDSENNFRGKQEDRVRDTDARYYKTQSSTCHIPLIKKISA